MPRLVPPVGDSVIAAALAALTSCCPPRQATQEPWSSTDLDRPCSFLSESGPTVRQIIGSLEGSYSANLVYEGDGGSTALRLVASYAGGAVTCTPPICVCDGSNEFPMCCAPCAGAPLLVVPLSVTFKTDDGLFEETLTLSADAPLSATGQSEQPFWWDVSLLPAALQGAFREPRLVSLDFSGAFFDGGSSGRISADLATADPLDPSLSPVGSW